MVVAVGSMLVSGVFRAGGLLTGLAKTVTGLKQTEKEGKSTETEMKRMSGTAKKLGGALALIGAGAFTGLMMTAPQLSAALFRIKIQLKLIAWSIGKHLKPLLDAVGKILHGIRTGDWSMIIDGIKDAWNAIKGLVGAAWEWLKKVYNSIWEELDKVGIDKPGWIIWIENWILELERIIKEKDYNALWDWVIAPLKVVWDKFLETNMGGMVKKLMDEVKKEDATFKSIGLYIWQGIWQGIVDGISAIPEKIRNIFKFGPLHGTGHGMETTSIYQDMTREASRKSLHESYLPYGEMGIPYQSWDKDMSKRQAPTINITISDVKLSSDLDVVELSTDIGRQVTEDFQSTQI